MARAISIKLDEKTFNTAERCIKKMRTNRNAYINRAIRLLNRLNERRDLRHILQAESAIVRESSLKILREFDGLLDEGF